MDFLRAKFFRVISSMIQGTDIGSSAMNVSSHASWLENEAIVEKKIQFGKAGRVYYQGTWWPARCEKQLILSPGEEVYVIGRKNITLLVEPKPLCLMVNQ